MKYTKLPRQIGFGLIEVLITLLVLSIGLLTLAKFQSSVTEESRFNKARSEARAICEDAITAYRQPVSLENFNNLGSIAATNYTGTVETYTLTRTVASATTDNVKQVTATCTWGDAGPDETISLSTEVSPHRLTIAALAAGGDDGAGAGLSPSLNAGASNDITQSFKLVEIEGLGKVINVADNSNNYGAGDAIKDVNNQIYIVSSTGTSARAAYLCADVPISVGAVGVNAGTMLAVESFKARRLLDSDGAFTADIELFEPYTINNLAYCVPRLRYNGGVIVPIRGTVYTGVLDNQGDLVLQDLDLFTLDISETGTYCVANASESNYSKTYNCYVGGNCVNGPAGTDDTDFFQCPTNIPTKINVDGPGGWRGRVGIFGLADLDYSSCFAEEITSDTETTRSTARSYYSRYTVSTASASYSDGSDVAADDLSTFLSTLEEDQGLNQPQTCQDFLIIDTQSSNTYKNFRKECVAASIALGNPNLAPKNIQRTITTSGWNFSTNDPLTSPAEANVYVPAVNQQYCSAPTYSFTVITSNYYSVPTISVVPYSGSGSGSGSGSVLCEATAVNQYSCEFTSSETNASIKGILGSDIVEGVAPCDELTLSSGTITGSDGSNVSSCSLGSFNGSVLPDDRRYVFNGVLTPPSDGNQGMQEILVRLTNGTVIACEITGLASYTCDFVAPDIVVGATVEATAADGYSVDAPDNVTITLIPDSSEIDAAPAFSTSSTVTVSTYTVAGTVDVPAINGGIQVSIDKGENAVCSFPELDDYKNTTESFTCEIPVGSVSQLTFNLVPQCSSTQNRSYWVSVDGEQGQYSGQATYQATSENLNVAVTISIGSNNSCNLQPN